MRDPNSFRPKAAEYLDAARSVRLGSPKQVLHVSVYDDDVNPTQCVSMVVGDDLLPVLGDPVIEDILGFDYETSDHISTLDTVPPAKAHATLSRNQSTAEHLIEAICQACGADKQHLDPRKFVVRAR